MNNHKQRKISELEQYLLDIKWKPVFVNGIQTKYEVSSCGMIKSLYLNIILQPCLDGDGYPQVNIYVNGKRYCKKVHRLVAETFIPNPDNKPEVNHKDGNKENNDISNLEWVTNQENIDHAVRTGLRHYKNALNGGKHKYEIDVVHKICRMLEDNKILQKDISQILNVPKNLVSSIKQRKIWLSISCQYNIPKASNKGEMHVNSKYTNDQIHNVCKMLENLNNKGVDISKETGVDCHTICSIRKKRLWTDISSNYDIKDIDRRFSNNQNHYTDDQIEETCKYIQEGKLTAKQISDITGVKPSVVYNIKCYKAWNHISSKYNFV